MAVKKIFFSYSSQTQDVELYNRIYKHFAAYSKIGLLGIVDKNEIFKINNDKSKIDEILKDTYITIPLLSIDYIADDECLRQLDSASSDKKIIVPILLRDFDWEVFQKIDQYKQRMLPDDRTSVETHLGQDSDKDKVFKEIAQQVKQIVLPEIGDIRIRKSSNTFYYITAAIVLAIGFMASLFLYKKTQELLIAGMALLMFVFIALIALKHVLFPNKINISK